MSSLSSILGFKMESSRLSSVQVWNGRLEAGEGWEDGFLLTPLVGGVVKNVGWETLCVLAVIKLCRY